MLFISGVAVATELTEANFKEAMQPTQWKPMLVAEVKSALYNIFIGSN